MLDEKKLWKFLETYTKPDSEEQFPAWKEDLDEIFL